LLAILNDGSQPAYWKAASAGLLSSWLGDPAVDAALLQQLSADHPLVRSSAARTLAPLAHQEPAVGQAMQRLLADPSRSVRLAAASALQDQLDPNPLAGREFAIFLDQQSDQPAGQLQQAMYCIARHDAAGAAAHLHKAVEWEQRSATLRREVAVAYGMVGQSSEAAAQLEEACRLDPRNADYQYLLGLSYAEMSRPQQSIAALERAVQLDPHHARAWYNLGLARRDMGQPQAALAALLQSESADPADPDVPYARATLLLQLGRTDNARQAAYRALQIRPGYAPAQQLLQNIERQ
jgi:tetratricopeptide (TPR) repeat protein